MLTAIHPKLPMRNKEVTRRFYMDQLGFKEFGIADFEGYLMMQKDEVQLHFFEYRDLDPMENYGQVYIRCNDISGYYQTILDNKTRVHSSGRLEVKPWGKKEFSVLDPDHNLLTFGQDIQGN